MSYSFNLVSSVSNALWQDSVNLTDGTTLFCGTSEGIASVYNFTSNTVYSNQSDLNLGFLSITSNNTDAIWVCGSGVVANWGFGSNTFFDVISSGSDTYNTIGWNQYDNNLYVGGATSSNLSVIWQFNGPSYGAPISNTYLSPAGYSGYINNLAFKSDGTIFGCGIGSSVNRAVICKTSSSGGIDGLQNIYISPDPSFLFLKMLLDETNGFLYVSGYSTADNLAKLWQFTDSSSAPLLLKTWTSDITGGCFSKPLKIQNKIFVGGVDISNTSGVVFIAQNPDKLAVIYNSDPNFGQISTLFSNNNLGAAGFQSISGMIFGIVLEGVENPPCLLRGSKVLMADRTEKDIDYLKPGDMVLGVISKKPKKVEKLLIKTVDLRKIDKANHVYIIAKDSIKPNLPSENVLISGQHRVFVKVLNAQSEHHSQVLTAIPAKDLPNSTIYLSGCQVEYCHLQIEDDDGFFVYGLPVESFVNRT